jgi:hypothetical protein
MSRKPVVSATSEHVAPLVVSIALMTLAVIIVIAVCVAVNASSAGNCGR